MGVDIWGIAFERNLFIIVDAGVAARGRSITRGLFEMFSGRRVRVHYGALLTEGAPRWTGKILEASPPLGYTPGEAPEGCRVVAPNSNTSGNAPLDRSTLYQTVAQAQSPLFTMKPVLLLQANDERHG